MNEDEYLNAIRGCWPSQEPSIEGEKEALRLLDEALSQFPSSSKLWVMRGDLLQLAGADTSQSLSECEHCYREAVRADRRNPEAYEGLAWFLDAVMGKPRKAKQYFEKARRLGKASSAGQN